MRGGRELGSGRRGIGALGVTDLEPRDHRPVARTIAALLMVAVVAAGCNRGAPGRSFAPSTSPTSVTASTTTSTTTMTTTIDPGKLPQTSDQPSDGAPLQERMQELWRAIVDGSPDEGLPLFFPRSAYVSMKAGLLADPASDYSDRLVAFYRLDIATYHQELGVGVGAARLISVGVAAGDATWVPPGACENSIGYWHLPGIRLVYTEGATVQSFAVASLISWRGTWYVVHLGPNPRPADVGAVDQPATGPGVPGPAGGC
ncbi:MAG TPA: hypothetical protein VMU76_05600 [Acidimicrobiales bacterium]|nr:hypothetical protein [Acidimicrobiales bacterium]